MTLPFKPAAVCRSSYSPNIAVIGAGAAGLVAARELRREGLGVVVFERGNQVGGTWIYTSKTESDPLGISPNRDVVHSSLYASLRTNLPRECMGFLDFPFLPVISDGRDPRRFPGHAEVLHYLEDFASKFELYELIKFETEVSSVILMDGWKWKVRYRGGKGAEDEDCIFDSVVVCCGHFTEPRVAQISSINSWPGKQMHSHNYRTPERFRDQVVVLIGSSSSAVDISSEVAAVAKEVHISTRSSGITEAQHSLENIWFHPMIRTACEDGVVIFEDESAVLADSILHCTGYKYYFPFLDINGAISVDDNRVGPLYKHVFPPSLAPSLSFIGLPWKIIPFPLFEMQSKWIAGILCGRIVLPSEDEMLKDVDSFYMELEASGFPKRYTHNMGDYQHVYNEWLATECGCKAPEEWRKTMYIDTANIRSARPNTYRDEFYGEESISNAYTDFAKYVSN